MYIAQLRLTWWNKQLLLITFCDATAGIEASFWMEGQTDVEVEIVILRQ